MVFLDARELPDGHRTTTDVCIVGGGPAGLTIARKLAGGSRSVTLLEGGGFEFDAEVQRLYEGQHVGGPPYDLSDARLRYLGGASNHWQGWCRPLDRVDLEAADRPPVNRWPIQYRELAEHYPAAHDIIELPTGSYDAQRWAAEVGRPLLPLGGTALASTMLQVRPTRFATTYRREFEDNDVSTQLHANVVELIADTDRVTSLTVAHLDGRVQHVEADTVVIATGGIENARLLLASDGFHRGGIGNTNDLVGRYFMEHPHVDAGQLLHQDDLDLGLYHAAVGDGDRPLEGRAILVPDDALRHDHGVSRFAATLWPGDALLGIYRVGSLGRLAARDVLGLDATDRHARVELMVEQLPSRHNRVELSRDRDALGMRRSRLVWSLQPAEQRTIRRGMELLAAQLGAAGIGTVRSSLHAGRGRVSTFGASHHMGTTRMHDDPTHGVVDRDAKVHGVENLYVAGSSVFTTGGYANPTLTLVALADRLATHLTELG